MRWRSSTFWKTSSVCVTCTSCTADELRPVARGLVDRLEHRGGAERILVAVLEPLEGLERRLVIGRLREDVAIELDRARHVLEALLVEIRDAVLEADRLRRIRGHLALAREDREQLLPVLGLLVEDVEARERLEIVRIELEDLRVGVDRLRHVAELALVDRADLVVDALLLFGVGDEVRLLRVDGEQLGPVREAEVALDERVERAHVVAVDLEHLLVDRDGLFGSLEHVLFDRRGLEEGFLLVVRLLEDLGLALEDQRELGVLARGAEQALERLGGREVHRVDLEHLAVARDRRLLILRCRSRRRARRSTQSALASATSSFDAAELFVDVREILEAARRAGHALELLLRLLVARVLFEGARVREERLVRDRRRRLRRAARPGGGAPPCARRPRRDAPGPRARR